MQGRFNRLVCTVVAVAALFSALGVSHVNAANPTVSVNPSSLGHGDTLQVSGSGYLPKYTVIIAVVGNNVQWQRYFSTRADSNGNITDITGKLNYYPLVIPCDMPAGDYTLYAASYDTSGSNNQPAKATFTVTSAQNGPCAKSNHAPPPPTGITPTPKKVHNDWRLGFNLKVKHKVIAPGQVQTVVADTKWPEVFTGKVTIQYDRHHHPTKPVHTNKHGVLTYNFRVSYRTTHKITARVIVMLSGTVLGQRIKGKQHVDFTIRPTSRR
jgi:hypothetical protein